MFTKFLMLGVLLLQLFMVHAQAPIQPAGQAKQTRQEARHLTAVLGAFPPEVALLRSQIQEPNDHVYQNIRFTEGTLQGRHIVLAQTGIGKVNSAAVTALMLQLFNPEEVIFTGIAGGINTTLQPGDLVIATEVAHHDYGTITPDSLLLRKTRNPFTMEENPDYFTCDSALVNIAVKAAGQTSFTKIQMGDDSIVPKAIKGTIVSGDVFVSSDKATDYLRTRLHADATEMEGAAVGQICYQQGVPFVVVRSMSDNANNKASFDVKTFYQVAANNSAALVLQFLKLVNERTK